MKLKKLNSKKSKAQAMVEFAIALPVLLLLLYGIIETGRLLFMYSTVVTASRQAVRYGSATGLGNGLEKRYQDCDGIRAAAEQYSFLGPFTDNNITIGWDSGPTNPPTAPNPYCAPGMAADTTSFTPSGNNSRISVTVSQQFTPIVKLVPFKPRLLTATSARTILVSVPIKVEKPGQIVVQDPTTIVIDSHNPNPSELNQAVKVVFTVQDTDNSTNSPTGIVNITADDGTSCSYTLIASDHGIGDCFLTFISSGTKIITATYSGDDEHLPSSITGVGHVVQLAHTVTTITSTLPNPSVTNQNVTVFVTVTGGSTPPAGTVAVSAGGSNNCSVTLNGAGTGSCTLNFNTNGTKTITGTYSGDGTHTGSVSNGYTHTVISGPTTITNIISHTPDPSVTGGSVTVSVTVSGTTAPTGTVNITGADTNCTITLVSASATSSNGSCTTVVFNTPGGKTITATYTGDGTHNSSNTSTSHAVSLPVTVTAITVHTPDPSEIGQTVNVTVSVTGGATTPTGTVTISGADTPCIITLASGTGSCNVIFNFSGTKTLAATYSGDTTHAASNTTATHTVNAFIASPVPSCNLIVHGPIIKSGNTMSMTVTNPYVFPLTTGAGTVTWNDDKGHQTGSDKTLSLQSVTIGGTTVWTGNSSNVSTIPFANPAIIPAGPNTTITITFTFHQSYDNFDGTEKIYINLTTPGCTNNPIQSQ